MNEEFLKAIEHLLDQKLDQKLAPIHNKLAEMDDKLNLLVEGQPEDIGAILNIINQKLDSIKHDVEFTYQKASMNELEINRLKHQ